MTARLFAAAAAFVWACSGSATADVVPECPPDLGIAEPIGPCGRDGNGPAILDVESTTMTVVGTAPAAVDAPVPVLAAPRYTG